MGRHALQVSVPDIAFELSRPALGHTTRRYCGRLCLPYGPASREPDTTQISLSSSCLAVYSSRNVLSRDVTKLTSARHNQRGLASTALLAATVHDHIAVVCQLRRVVHCTRTQGLDFDDSVLF